MLMTMTAAGSGGETRLEQRMEVPGHGFLDVAASLDRDGMRECLASHLAAGHLRSALAQARAYALPRLMEGIVGGNPAPHSTRFEIGGTRIAIELGT